MPADFVLLEKITVGAAGASSVTFSGIPQTGYTDLVVKCSVRSDRASSLNSYMRLYPNGSSTSITLRALTGNGSSVGSQTESAAGAYVGEINAITSTASTFSSVDIYLPNYAGSTNKSYSVDAVMENNATTAYSTLVADLWSNTSAITSIQLLDALGNFVQGSTFYLYGVAKLGTTPVISPYATGGDIIDTDGTYWYHTFLSSGTFTPQKALSCDYLVVAGGAAGSGDNNAQLSGGGGGAGGYRTSIGGSSLSLASNTAYTVTIGAGGAGSRTSKSNGSNSVFDTITSTGGGAGGIEGSLNGNSGGSGGGGGANGSSQGTGGAASPSGQGNAGGAGITASWWSTGGGGGAGATGSVGTAGASRANSLGGNGGNGLANSISGSSVTYAGGGGGAGFNLGGSGGTGGGGTGGGNGISPIAGTVNTGGGGGGGAEMSSASGGSGIVIVRYAV